MNYGEEEDPIFHAFVFLDVGVFIQNIRDKPAKFDSKVDKGIFLWYSNLCKAYRVFTINDD